MILFRKKDKIQSSAKAAWLFDDCCQIFVSIVVCTIFWGVKHYRYGITCQKIYQSIIQEPCKPIKFHMGILKSQNRFDKESKRVHACLTITKQMVRG